MARAAAALLALLPLAAAAAPATYRCEDGQVLTMTSTPFVAHVKRGEQQWQGQRVRESREAVYLGPQKSRLELRGSRLEWTAGGETARCRLVPQSIAAQNVYVPPSASAPAR